MHARIAELVHYITVQRAVLIGAVGGIGEEQRSRRVHPDDWSVAEVLEHLHRVESGVARVLARSIERARSAGVALEEETSSVLDSLDSFGLGQRGLRITAPDAVRPRGELNAGQALSALEKSREALLAALEGGDGLALAQISYPHPILGVLHLYQWVLFVGQHETRHAAQISDIGRALGRA